MLLEKEENSPQFEYLAKQLRETNIDFFVRQAEKYKRSFLFEVEISYDYEQSLFNSVCLNAFPFFKRVNLRELGKDQIKDFLAQGKRISNKHGPQKLVSTHENRTLIEFIDNLLYMITHHSVILVNILSVVVFETESYMKSYIQDLQNHRAKASSPLQKKVIKLLGNAIPGKCHQRTTNHITCSVAATKDQFLKHVHKTTFLDYKFVSHNTCVVLHDGLVVPCTQLPHISARVYRFDISAHKDKRTNGRTVKMTTTQL